MQFRALRHQFIGRLRGSRKRTAISRQYWRFSLKPGFHHCSCLLAALARANVGLPGTSGFVGEFLTLVGIFKVNTWIALLATSGVVLSAAYALWLYRRVMMGDLIKEALRTIQDMSLRERAVFAPLVFMTLLLGVYPVLALDLIGPSVQSLIDNYNSALSIAGIDGNAMIASH